MKILIADKLPDSSMENLKKIGCEISYKADLKSEDLADEIVNNEGLIVRSTKVNKDVLEAGKYLQLIIRAGAGTNTIDVATASDKGVFVANCPGKNAVAVAELSLAFILAMDRKIDKANMDLKEGNWNKKLYSKADGVLGKTLGVLGLGTIGQELAVRAKALGLNVLAYSRSLTEEKAKKLGVALCNSPEDLARRSDIVSVHMAFNPETKGIVGKPFLDLLKPGAIVVNSSRGGVVDEIAMLQAIENKGIRYASDVFNDEPGSGKAKFDNPLAMHPKTICTPHIGASTQQAQVAVADEAFKIIKTFMRSGEVLNCVNLCEKSATVCQLNVRHLNKVGVLAGILDLIKSDGINVAELENIIMQGKVSACAKIRLSEKPGEHLKAKIEELESVMDARVLEG